MSETGQPPQPELVTPRLRLRRVRPSDAALIGLYASDAKIARMTTSIPHPYPPGLAESFVERIRSPAAPATLWVLDTGADGENGLIGTIAMRRRGEEARIGYWVAPAFWGAGYAGEAVAAVVAHAAALGLRAVEAQVFQDNLASARVLMRTGFTFVGTGETHSVARGAMVPTFRYRREL